MKDIAPALLAIIPRTNMDAKRRRQDAQAHAQLAVLLAAAGKPARAADHFQRALSDLVVVREVQGERDASVEAAVKTVRLHLANTLATLKRPRDAVSVYEAVLHDDPDAVAALVNLAGTCVSLPRRLGMQHFPIDHSEFRQHSSWLSAAKRS